ncbi:glycosyltransferase family 1 protein [Glonium stellatum]|uniref:Glycosyltransferase family 1 protein n=1 Tax=Glonium stellatum TaxID=574774 RepID=A0A8E2EPH1_9PEZI|nr:glycosyltransferase family 1 protein [Glonium stellatum]
MACMSAFGHLEKFKDAIESIGAKFVPLDGSERMMSEEDMATFMSMPAGLDTEAFAIKNVFLKAIPDHHRTMQRVFRGFREKYGTEQPLIFLYDSSFLGVAPVLLGAPGIRPDHAIGIGLSPFTFASDDTMPFRSGFQPDVSSKSREIHQRALNDQKEEPFFKDIHTVFLEVLKSMGVQPPVPSMWDAFGLLPDRLLQLGIPEFEYPRSDLRPNVKFIGALPSVGLSEPALPPWWDDVLAAKKNNKVVVAVSSGSVDNNPEDLIIPTLKALKDREDILVIATLVASENLGSDLDIPSNARIAKFVPFDILLPHVSILVSNGGYGTVQQALRIGVPMVLAGVGQDKAQTSAIADWAGVAINLAARRPAEAGIKRAVVEIIKNPKYREKAAEFALKYREYDALEAVYTTLQEILSE